MASSLGDDQHPDRLLDQHVTAGGDRLQRDLVVEMGGRGDDQRVRAGIDQLVHACHGMAAKHGRHLAALRLVGIGDADVSSV